MPIQGLSEKRRMPRLGKIHLGVKEISKKTGKEYPTEVEHFVVPEKVAKIFGEKPKELRIMFPVESEEIFFSQHYKCYGYNLLKCKGDGKTAWTWDEEKGGLKEIPCPCEKLEKGDCKECAILQFLLPDVDGAGIWQITTGSKNSIIDINSSIELIRSLCGRVRMIPLILRREKMEMQRIEDGKPKKSSHYTLRIDLDNVNLRQLQMAAQIPPEQILLPPADEDKDDLFYPPNGFKPEEEEEKPEEAKEKPKDATPDPRATLAKEQAEEKKRAKEKEAFEKAELVKAGHDLEALLKSYQDLGGKIMKKQAERITELKTKAEIDKAVEFFTLKKEALERQAGDGEIPF